MPAARIPTLQTTLLNQPSAQTVDGSLKFAGGYLTRRPAADGDRRKWTYSCWVKFDENKAQSEPLLCAGDGSSDFTMVYTYKSLASDITLAAKTSSSDKVEIASLNLLRDTGWYHIVAVFNSTGAGYQTDTTVYVNGVDITRNTNTYAGGQNYESWVNSSAEPHYLGLLWNGNTLKGEMSQVYLIDGMALGPGYFGYTDPLTNTWRPKKFEATGTTVNNGSVWSSGMTAAGSGGWKGGYEPAKGFDEVSDNIPDLTTWIRSSAPSNNGLITFTPATPITYYNSIRAYNKTGSSTMYSATWSLNGGPATSVDTVTTDGWVTIATGSGKLTTLSTTRNGDGEFFATIEIDGIPLLDSRTQNVGYGTCGCYLPMDGNTPIGRDQSGVKTVNDGTTWSSYITSSTNNFYGDGGYHAQGVDKGFDGDTSTYVQQIGGANPNYITFTPPVGIDHTSLVEVWLVNAANEVSYNGGALQTLSSGSWQTVASGSGTLTSLKFERASSSGASFNAIRVDGTTLINNMIGNSWTPVNFSGSTALDKATGALPILNTVSGGRVSTVGVRTDAYAHGDPEGINDGTVWSNKLTTSTGSFTAGYLAPKAFDGNPSTYAAAGTGSATDWIGASNLGFSGVKTITLKTWTTKIEINGVSVYTNASGSTTTQTFVVTDFDSFKSYGKADGSKSDLTYVEVDGTELLDNPALGGGLILALPLAGELRDVSNQINSNSTIKVVTNSGTTAESGFSHFYENEGSYNFDGSNDKITIAPTNASDFTCQNDFTIEGWIYVDAFTTADAAIFSNWDTGNNRSILVGPDASGADRWTFMYNTSGSGAWTTFASPAATPYLTKWTHIAYSYDHSSTTHRAFVDGIMVGSDSSGTPYNNSGANLLLGINKGDGSGYFDGKMQDVRFYHNVKYTEDFIPASTNPDILPETPAGLALKSNLTAPTGGAVYFSGDSDTNLKVVNSETILEDGEFTIEFFISTTSTADDRVLSLGVNNATGSLVIMYDGDGIRVNWNNTGASGGTLSVKGGGWHHVALVRDSSNNLKSYIDGYLDWNGGSNTEDFDQTPLQIADDSTVGGTEFPGYLSNIRIVKGTALYTTGAATGSFVFTPPEPPLANITNTKVLCCQSSSSVTDFSVAPGGDVVSSQNYSSNPTIVGGTVANPSSAFDNGSGTWANLTAYSTDCGASVDFVFPQSISNVTKIEAAFDSPSGSGDTRGRYNGSNAGNTRTGTGSGYSDIYSGSAITVTSVGFGINQNDTSGTNNDIVSRFRVTIGGTATILADAIFANGNPKVSTFTPSSTDTSMVRGPATGYCTLNPLNGGTKLTLTNGNLTATGATGHACAGGTLYVSGGKWYWEAYMKTVSTTYSGVGMARDDYDIGSGLPGYDTDKSFIMYSTAGAVYYNSTGTVSYGTSWTTGDMIGCRYDDGYCYFYKNNVLMNTSPMPAVTTSSGYWTPVFQSFGDGVWDINFGQKPFRYTPPEGHQPICNLNRLSTITNPLEDEIKTTTVIPRSDQYVGISTWTGDGTNNDRTIPSSCQPDLIWSKSANHTYDNNWFDSVRGFGSNNAISTNDTGGQGFDTGGRIKSVDRTGITWENTSGDSAEWYNGSDKTYVSWYWKAGGDQPISDLVFGVNTDDNGFDSSNTTRTYDTTSFSFASYSIPQSHPGGTYGANSAQVYKSSSGKVVKWSVSTSTATKYIWTSSDGTNWVSPGSQYSTSTTPANIISKWIALSGGANAASLTVKGSHAYNIDDIGYASASDVNMSAGALNSSVYDTSQVWNAGNSANNTTDPSMCFRGNLFVTGFGLGSAAFSDSTTHLTDKEFTVESEIAIWAKDPATIGLQIEFNGTTYTRPGGTVTYSDWTVFKVPPGKNCGWLKCRLESSSDEIRGVRIDGKILVNNGTTPQNMPTCANTGASVGTKSGFSVIDLETPGSSTAGYSFAHGLGTDPGFVLAKQYEYAGSGHIYVWHKDLKANNYILLTYTNAANAGATAWANNKPDSNVFYDTASGHWGNEQKMIYYMWADRPGLQKFGIYKGNNNHDGPYMNLGFKPAIIIFKNTSSSSTNWMIYDNVRDPNNETYRCLYPNLDNAQNSTSTDNEIDIVSTGFKLRNDQAQSNDADTYIYAAWASQAVSNFYGAQSNAR